MSVTSRALAFASLWFDAATVDRVFAPLVADWQREWIDAPLARRRWILTQGIWWFAATFVLMVPGAMLRATAPDGVLRRVATRVILFIMVACGLMSALMMTDARGVSPSRMAWLMALLLPSFVASAIPFAIAYVVDTVRQRPEGSPAERMLMAKLAVAASLFLFAFGGWAVPPVNQMFRIKTRGYDVPVTTKGVRELTTAELLFDPKQAAEHEPYTGGADRATRIRAELHNRAYLIALPLLLVWMRWKALERPHGRLLPLQLPLPASLSSFLTIVFVTMTYFSGWRIEMGTGLPRGTGIWIGLAALFAWGLLTPIRRRVLIAAATAFQNSRIA
ncbi:MAG TPA: hypothetical protein VNT81_07175 [Vicinamibacterales bacterium]|nr:hypothetical protein [Vicinamibacterales bacterium]